MEGHLSRFAELNGFVRSGRFGELVQRDEARHAARLRRIAERIAARAPVVKLALVAGPSSAGKTTTSFRLCDLLDDAGISAMRLSTDDYFYGADELGGTDWESVRAVNADRLAADVSRLVAGEPVKLRRYDFVAHRGYDAERETALRPGSVVVLEGLHALNPELTPGFDEAAKFRVYINLFTRLTEEAGDAFFADDVRLVRRLVRDCAFRGASPRSVLDRWPGVERGEERWINPFRRLADAVFNTALDYELAVLKPFAARLLEPLAADPASDAGVGRLLRLLAAVEAAPADAVPDDSILRETVGGSRFDYA